MTDATQRHARRTARKLALIALAMFGFGYGLALSYDTLCRLIGINPRTEGAVATPAVAQVDTQRTVTVEFTGNSVAGLPWEFEPRIKRLDVHPGETITVNYYVRNTAPEALTGQAVPSVTPAHASTHFKKIECFCFTQQHLTSGETRDMPVRFMVDPALGADVHTVTLSYSFFNADKASAAKYGGATTQEHSHRGMHVGG
jgi:cytochrome c oxidase assembly protein subunit 11